MAEKPRITVYVVNLSTKTKKRKYWSFQWINPVTQKRETRTSKCTTKREAERAAGPFEDRLNAQLPDGTGAISWEDFQNLYDEEHLQSLKGSSTQRVRAAFNVFTKIAAPATLGQITTGLLSAYATKLRGKPWNRSEATIATSLSIIATALHWAVDRDYLAACPRIPRISRARGTRAKGRPITDDEFAKFIFATRKVVGDAAAPSWSRLLIGLWLSGLRLDEALGLVWGDGKTHQSTLWIDTSGKYPLLGVVAESEKGKRDRLLPLTPDFGRWLLRIPKEQRVGLVFPLTKQRHHGVIRMTYVSKMICRIGKAAGVNVNASGKFCSAHDLRRTFGLRWARKVMPAELQQLMRHEDISTTMKFYALIEAEGFAERLWNAE